MASKSNENCEDNNEGKQTFDYSNREVHKLAYTLFPDAVFINQSDTLQEKVQKTKELLNRNISIIGGWFCHENLYIYIDILDYQQGWKAFSIQKNHLRNIFQIEDIVLQYLLAEKNGLQIKKFNLISINKKYTRKNNLDIKKLFYIKSILNQIQEKIPYIEKCLLEFSQPLQKSSIHQIDIGNYCFKPTVCNCQKRCWSHIPENSVFEIAALARETKFQLYQNGIIRQEDITGFEDFTEAQKMQITTYKKQKEIVDKKNLREFLSKVTYPAFYMDFESFMPVIPLFDNTRPFQHIPVQYSLVKKTTVNDNEKFFDFLAQPPEYPVKNFIKNLLKDLGSEGSIFVYDRRLETRQLLEISHLYPEYAPAIEKVIERIIDLIIPFQKRFYYTPKMKGLASLKNTLPAIYPDFSYQNLAIQNGFMAIMALESLYYETSETKIEETRKNLREYCQLDTIAMVKIHDFFQRLVR